VPGTGHTLDGGVWRDTYLHTLAWMRSLQQGQEVARQQAEIAWGGPVLSHSAERGRDVVDRSGSQS
jgi:hypothetical protein